LDQTGVIEPLGAGKLEDAKPDCGLYDQKDPNSIRLRFDLQLHLIEVSGLFQGGNTCFDLFFPEWFSRMLRQERQQFAGIEIRTASDLYRSHILTLVGRQEGLGLWSCLRLVHGPICRLGSEPATEEQQSGEPHTFYGCPDPELSRHADMSHEQLIPRHLPVRCRKGGMRLMREVALIMP
jgi:hypothetical protein